MYVEELARLWAPETPFITYLPDGHFQMLRDVEELVDYYGGLEVDSLALDSQCNCIEINFR